MKRLFCVAGALAGGLTLSQVPEFSQQYSQRLGGAIDEVRAIVERFDADAAAQGLTREEGLERYGASPDAFLVARGVAMEAVIARHAQLESQQATLSEAGPLERVYWLVRSLDADVGEAALATYQPAVPVTAEGLTHLGAGLLAGYGLVWGGWSAVAFPLRRRRRKPA